MISDEKLFEWSTDMIFYDRSPTLKPAIGHRVSLNTEV